MRGARVGGGGGWCRPPKAACWAWFLGSVLPEKNLKENLEGLIFFACYLVQVCVLVGLGEVTELNMV